MRTDWTGRAGFAAAAAAALLSTAAEAQRVQTGTMWDGSTWQAKSQIVGVNPTTTIAGGGDPRYLAPQPAASGVVTLIMTYSTGSFICTGTLLPDRQSILTAAHCVSDGTSARPLSTTIYFPDATVDGVPFSGANVGSRAVTNYTVHPSYTGEVIDQNDVAVLRMASPAPASARSYGLFTGGDLSGKQFNVMGYGARSSGGGNVGDDLGVGRLRQGQNRMDFRFGDAAFGGFFTTANAAGNRFFGKADVNFSFVSDFDNGKVANDASCNLAAEFAAGGPKFCNLGTGLDEVSTAGGDSGGPSFIDGQIAAITSYGLTFNGLGDIDGELNSTFGEFNGFVPVYIHAGFITASMVPEPATIGLMAFGLGALGVVARRRRRTA